MARPAMVHNYHDNTYLYRWFQFILLVSIDMSDVCSASACKAFFSEGIFLRFHERLAAPLTAGERSGGLVHHPVEVST